MRPTFTLAAEASIAARRPAPPAPITSTSYSNVLYSAILKEPYVVPDAHRAKTNINVGEPDAEQAQPRKFLVARIQARDAIIGGLAGRRLRQSVHHAAHQMAQ